MVNYATQPDLEAYFGSEELLIAADRDGSGKADPGVVTSGLTAATEEIDAYLGVTYTLPLLTIPGVLTRVCCDLAMYHMSVGSPSMTEDKEIRYERGIKWLKALTKGEVTLGLEESTEVVTGGQSEAQITESIRRFTRETMRDLL